MMMILPREINERFYKSLKKKEMEYGRGFNKFLCGETGYSTGYISQVLNNKQDASQEAQIKISEAMGVEYKSFFDTPQPTPLGTEDIKKIIASEMNKHKTNDLEKHLQNKYQSIIHDLQELEKLDPAALKEIHNYIKFQLHEKQPDKTMGGMRCKIIPFPSQNKS